MTYCIRIIRVFRFFKVTGKNVSNYQGHFQQCYSDTGAVLGMFAYEPPADRRTLRLYAVF